MSISSRSHHTEIDPGSSRLVLPVFVSPTEIAFAMDQRKTVLSVFNPYNYEAHFRIMTTNPERYEFSVTKGNIKPSRRIDVVIRLVSSHIDELPEPEDEELETIDHVRVTFQIGQTKGHKAVKILWCRSSDILNDESKKGKLLNSGDRARSKSRSRSLRTNSPLGSSVQFSTQSNVQSGGSFLTRSGQYSGTMHYSGSNVNLVCTICAIACVITLFLPLSIDSEFCKRAKQIVTHSHAEAQPDDQESFSPPMTGLVTQLSSLLSVSYEMKLGCSFALGLFTYRLISTLPD